jgi:tetratricopeptide (TPR) repeat protein
MVEVGGGGRARISAELPLGLAVVGIWLAWAWFDGGFEPSLWGSLGAALVALLLIGGPVLRWSGGERLRLIAGVALLLFVAWNFLSLAWAQFPGEAWTGADKTAAYAAGLALLAFARFRPRELVLLLGVYAAGVIVIAAVVLGRTALADDPGRWFSDSRLVPPTGYTNASVALWMLAFWPALFLGSTRAAPALLRPFFLAGAGLLLEIAVLGESRAWAVVLPLTAIVFVLLARERARALLGLAVVGAAMLAALRPLLDVYERGSAGATLAGPVDHAARATLLSCSALLLVGLVWTAVDSRPPLPRKLALGIAVTAAVVVVAGTVGGAVWAAARVDHPGRWVSARWHDFTCQTCGTDAGSSRFTGTLSDNRYREWVVAWKIFLGHPVAGVGADNYAAQYLLMRRDALIEPRYPHSTPLRLLEQLGLVGTLLFAAAASAAVALALNRRRRLDTVTGGAVAVALTVFVYWLLHSSVDWFWEIPALAGPAFGLLGLAAGNTTADSSPAPARVRLHPAAVAGVSVVLVAAVVALALPWLSYRYQQSATSVWRRDPGLAYDRLHRAADLDRLSARPPLLEGSIALARRDLTHAQTALNRAIGREPHSWYAWFQLGIADAGAGRPARAAADLRRARRLNPKDPVIALAARLLHRGIALDPARLDALYGTVERLRFGT